MASALATAARLISMRPPRREAWWRQFLCRSARAGAGAQCWGLSNRSDGSRNSLAALVDTIAWDLDGIQTGRGGVFQSKRKLRGLATLGDCEPLPLVGPRAQTILRAQPLDAGGDLATIDFGRVPGARVPVAVLPAKLRKLFFDERQELLLRRRHQEQHVPSKPLCAGIARRAGHRIHGGFAVGEPRDRSEER